MLGVMLRLIIFEGGKQGGSMNTPLSKKPSIQAWHLIQAITCRWWPGKPVCRCTDKFR